MRIAIYHNLPSGGGKRALWEMTKRLAEQHAVDVYTLSCAEHDFCDLRPYCEHHIVFPFQPLPLAKRPFGRLNQGIRTIDLLRLRALQRDIAAQIDRGGYDVVLVHNCQFNQSPSILRFLATASSYYCAEPPRQIYEPSLARPYTTLSRLQRLGNVVDPFPVLYRSVLKRLDQLNVQAASQVLVNSCYSREALFRAYGIFSWVCYLGADTELFRCQNAMRARQVLSVGAVRAGKGFPFLIESLATLPQAQRPPLVIVGNFAVDAEVAWLRELARQQQIQLDIRIRISDEELVALYNTSMLTLYAPVMEPFGLVPIESMACGTPVVGVREAGIRETVVDGETGVLTDRDPKAFGQAVWRLLDNQAERERMSSEAQAHVRANWRWDTTMLRLEALLGSITG